MRAGGAGSRAALLALLLTACAQAAPSAPPLLDASGNATPLVPDDLPAFFDCLRAAEATAVSAHRGGPAPGFAENAIETFERTLAHAPALLEIDIARTRDGALVLMHDDTLERTTTGRGEIRDATLAQVQALRLRDETGAVLEARPPTLRDALDWAQRRAVLELDVKRGVAFEDVVREVETAGAMRRVAFITYNTQSALRLADLAPEAMIYTTIRDVGDADALAAAGVDLSRIVAWVGTDAADTALIEALASRGVEARIGRFGARADFAGAAAAGVSIVAVDEPAAAARAFDAGDGYDGYGALACAAR